MEVNVKGEWGTINYHYWDIRDASVVCRMLGYQFAIIAGVASYHRFGYDSRPIWFGYLNCLGSERSIADCAIDTPSIYTQYYYYYYYYYYWHYYDARVVCYTGWYLIIDSTICSNLANSL